MEAIKNVLVGTTLGSSFIRFGSGSDSAAGAEFNPSRIAWRAASERKLRLLPDDDPAIGEDLASVKGDEALAIETDLSSDWDASTSGP